MKEKIYANKIIEKAFNETIEFLIGFRKNRKRKIKAIPTGVSSLDDALGVDGIPRGCLVLISGPAGCGKTSFAYYLAASIQKFGSKIEFIDIKHVFNLDYAIQFGVDEHNTVILHTEHGARFDVYSNGLLIIQPPAGDHKQILEKVKTSVKSKIIDMIIIDDIEYIFPNISNITLDTDIAAFSSILREWANLYRHSKTSIVILCNEGDPIERILKFYADIRLDVKLEFKKDTELKRLFKIKVIKNKFAMPFKEAEIHVSENYLKDSRQEKDMGLEVLCSDCSRNIEKGEMYWVTEDERGKEKYICELCESEKTSRGIEEDIKKYGKVVFTGLD